MPDKKLTDKEIVKALEIFVNSVGKGFVFANVDIKKDGVNEFKHIDLSFDEIFDLINRLQEENERLKDECKKQYKIAEATIRVEIADGGTSCHWCEDTIRGVAKAEAYKEFAERLKLRFSGTVSCGGGVIKIAVDNLLKELVGEDNG